MKTEDSEARISVVMPVLNEATTVAATLARLAEIHSGEVIVVDGGSNDATVALALNAGAIIVSASRGRGSQMRAGASMASGDVLWFLHADTLPPQTSTTAIMNCLRDQDAIGGHFEIKFDGSSLGARALTRLYRHLAWLGLRYGDSAYFVRRAAYESVGGFRDYPIFEDLDLLRRLRAVGRFVRVPATVTTSSRRFEGRSFLLVFARWAIMQALYWIGVSPVVLGKFYAPLRGSHLGRDMSESTQKVGGHSNAQGDSL